MPFLKGKSILVSRVAKLEDSAKKHGLRHAIYAPQKDKYVGQWKNDMKDGMGYIQTHKNHQYEGDWERNYRHGFGVLSTKASHDIYNLNYRGDWKNGRASGFGCKYFPDGYYEGGFRNSNRHNYGKMWYNDGAYYDGDWGNDLKQGLGLFVRPDGNRYEGFWVGGVKHGRGRFYHLDSGQLQEGVWFSDVCVYSTVEDIPYRQSAVHPTPYPIHFVSTKDA